MAGALVRPSHHCRGPRIAGDEIKIRNTSEVLPSVNAAWSVTPRVRPGHMSGDGNLSRVAGPRMSVRWPRGRGTGLRMSGRCPGAKSVVGDSHSFPVPGALWGVVCPSVLQWRPLGLLLLSDFPRRMTKCRKRVKMHGDSKCDSTPHFNSSNSTNPKIMRNFPQTTCGPVG